jgi:hypothetical protein
MSIVGTGTEEAHSSDWHNVLIISWHGIDDRRLVLDPELGMAKLARIIPSTVDERRCEHLE